jgi:hypothetical protein
VSRFIGQHVECLYAECCHTECLYAECRHAECHYDECRYAECRGAVFDADAKTLTQKNVSSKRLFIHWPVRIILHIRVCCCTVIRWAIYHSPSLIFADKDMNLA